MLSNLDPPELMISYISTVVKNVSISIHVRGKMRITCIA